MRRSAALIVEAALLQAGARVAVRVFGLQRAYRAACSLAPLFGRAGTADQVRWAVGASAARTGSTCLTQALAARALLGAAAASARFVVGTRRADPRDLHAWLDTGAVNIPATAADSYERLFTWS